MRLLCRCWLMSVVIVATLTVVQLFSTEGDLLPVVDAMASSKTPPPSPRRPPQQQSGRSSTRSTSSLNAPRPQRPPQQRPTVAIIGGGIAGLSAAQVLADTFQVTVFDTGRLRPGGRCSSRLPGDRPDDNDNGEKEVKAFPRLSQFTYDHAAQILTAPNKPAFAAFQKQVEEWQEQGIVQAFPENSLYHVRSANRFEPIVTNHNNNNQNNTPTMYYGTQGMGSIPLAMLDGQRFELKQDVWVSPSNGIQWMESSQRWRLQAQGRVLGYFDEIIIAHNGKCADRLLSRTPATRLHELLRVQFAPTVPAHGGQRMTLNSLYSLTVCFDAPSPLTQCLPATMMSAFIHHHPDLRFLTCQTRKYASRISGGGGTTLSPPPPPDQEVWTIFSSAPFAKRYKAPQEFIPPEVDADVTSRLLQAVQEALKLTDIHLRDRVVEHRLQLWGAAVPLNVWQSAEPAVSGQGFLYDAAYRIGVCGDWLVEPSIAGAWTSGRRLGAYLVSQRQQQQKQAKNDNGNENDAPLPATLVGLTGKFQRSEGASRVGIAALQ